MHKPGQIQLCLIFNYHFIDQNIPASHIEVATKLHNLLSIFSNKGLFYTNVKHGYWVVNVNLDDRHYY